MSVEKHDTFKVNDKLSCVFIGFSNQEFTRISRLWKIASTEYVAFIPAECITKPTVYKVYRDTLRNGGVTDNAARTVHLNPTTSDATTIHELVHVMLDKYTINVDFIEEGRATAIASLAASKLKLGQWYDVSRMEIGPTLQALISTGPHVSYMEFPKLLGIRYMYSAKFWIDAFYKRPSFIKEFTRRTISIIDTLKPETHYFCTGKAIDLINSIDAGIGKLATQMTSFHRSNKPENHIYTLVVWDTLKTSTIAEICLVERTGEGHEKLVNGKLFISLLNPKTGLQWQISVPTQNGSAKVVLMQDNMDIRNQIGLGKTYVLTAKSEEYNLEEKLSFDWE